MCLVSPRTLLSTRRHSQRPTTLLALKGLWQLGAGRLKRVLACWNKAESWSCCAVSTASLYLFDSKGFPLSSKFWRDTTLHHRMKHEADRTFHLGRLARQHPPCLFHVISDGQPGHSTCFDFPSVSLNCGVTLSQCLLLLKLLQQA